MLSYTDERTSCASLDELRVLRAALDRVSEGIMMLDIDLNAQFLNRKVRELWRVPDEQARPAQTLPTW